MSRRVMGSLMPCNGLREARNLDRRFEDRQPIGVRGEPRWHHREQIARTQYSR
jgi:hypothetical protein